MRYKSKIIRKFYILGFLNVGSIEDQGKYRTYKILMIPVLRVKTKDNKKWYKLFSILPILKTKEKRVDPYPVAAEHYNSVLKKLKKSAQTGNKIRVGFYIVEVFQYMSVFEEMLKSDFFDPFIVVTPDYERKNIMLETLHRTYDLLSQKYDKVYLGYDEKKDQYIDYSDKADIVFFGNPYESMAHPYHFIWHLLKKDILTCYQNYGFNTMLWGRNHICSLPFYNCCWTVFADSQDSMDDLEKYQPIHAQNAYMVGYCKMDKLSEVKRKPHDRKKILLCPHHTINLKFLPLSNFLKYANFFLELPKKYPQVDFIWHPHQLLINSLSKYWSPEKAHEYYDKITSYENVIYSVGQDYFQAFVDSDAMIHDCGSFTAEYLYTGKPCCYMLKSEEEIRELFLPIGQKCQQNYYHAFSEKDICDFIEKVVLDGMDPLKESREKFSETLKLNYPHVGKKITEYIKNEILK